MLHRKTASRAAFLLLLLAACSGDAGSPVAPEPAAPGMDISDAAHAGTVPGFYFLPPMVPQPSYTGTFDAALSPRVEICELAGSTCATVIATYTTTSGPGSQVVQVGTSHYSVNWHTNDFNLNVAKNYRISVFVGTFRLGFADVDPVASGKELKNVDSQEFIPLLDGRTLPIKFRIETGIAAAVTVSPATATIQTGQTQQFTATVTDLHGNTVAAPVAWSSSNTAVATINASGLATGVAPGATTIRATSGGASGTATLIVTTPGTPPVAVADSYEAIGNVTVPVAAPGVLANDTDAENNALSVAAPGSYATAAGGTVTLAADGGFTYLSAAGFTGTDSFTYAASDGSSTSNTATVTLTVGSRVWYVKNDAAAPGDGRDASPFATLKAAESASEAGENIFVLAGNGTTAGYDQGIVLKAGQSLTGQGVTSDIQTTLNGQTVVLLAAGSAPRLTRSDAGATIQLAAGNTVQGVSVASTAGAGIAGSGFGTFTAGSLSVAAVGGPALDLQNGTVAATFSALSSTGSGSVGLRLHGLAGTLDAAGGSISGAAAGGVDISGGTAAITYGGDVTSAAGHVVSVTGRTGGTVTISGDLHETGTGLLVQGNSGGTVAFTGAAKILNTGASPAVSLLNNGGATIAFNGGGLAATTTTATGFNASGGGTLVVTGANNQIGTTGAVALRVVGTTLGASGITFRSISASGGTGGIVLDDTGALGGLLVTGDGASAGSGGTIQGTTGTAVALTSARNVVLRLMKIIQPGASGIVAVNLSGTSEVERSLIDFGSTGPAGSYGVRLQNTSTSGTLTLDATTIQNKTDATAAVSVSGRGSSVVTLNVVDGNTADAFESKLTNLFGSGVLSIAGDDAGSTARVTTNVSDTRFVNAAPNGINNLEILAAQSGVADFNVSGNTFDAVGRPTATVGAINIQAQDQGRLGSAGGASGLIAGNVVRNLGVSSAAPGYLGLRVAPDNTVGGIAHNVTVQNNTFENIWRQAILVSSRGAADDVDVRITGNTIGTAAAPVGRSNRRGVEIEAQSSSTMDVEVTNNPSIVNAGTGGTNSALHIRSIGSASTINATVLGNTIGNAAAAGTDGRFRAETLGGSAAGVCLDLRGNSLDGAAATFDLLHAGTGSYTVEGPGTAAVTSADITAQNTVGTGNVSGAVTFSNGQNCPQPSL